MSTNYKPTAADAHNLAASKAAEIRMDRHDLASLTEALAELREHAKRQERNAISTLDLLKETSELLNILRLQLP